MSGEVHSLLPGPSYKTVTRGSLRGRRQPANPYQLNVSELVSAVLVAPVAAAERRHWLCPCWWARSPQFRHDG